jgi:murein DD-endopeptidase MepM/ murein hydrolase activator NlpD
MSTGAHVHYEILVVGRFVDPMRIKPPRGRSLEGLLMAASKNSATASKT